MKEKLKKMSIADLQKRMGELQAIGQNPENRSADELEQLAEERTAIDEELAERRAQAAAEQLRRDGIAAGTVPSVPVTMMPAAPAVRTWSVDSPEYRNAWLRAQQGREITAEERTALAGGGYAIPQETANKIWGKMELYPLLNAIDVMHIPGTVVLPVEGTVNDAAVVAMGTAATDSADSLSSVSLGIYKLIKTVEITADVAAMAVPAFEDWLTERLANKLFRLVAKKVAAGSGSSEPTGLTSIDATGHTYTKAAITFTDILAIIASLPTEYTPGAAFVMSRTTFWANVLAVKDSDNRPIVVADAQSPAKFNVLGFPVILEDEIGTDIVFGDLKEGYAFNFGKEPVVDRDASVGFRVGSDCFRVMALGDGKPTGVGLVRYTKAT